MNTLVQFLTLHDSVMIEAKEIDILGMKCSGCEAVIEEAVFQIEGVHFVKANYIISKVKVRFDTNKTSLEHIQEVCASKGYTFNRISDSQKPKKLQSIFSIIALAGLIIILLLARKFGHQLKLPEVNSMTSDGMIFLVGILTGLHCVGMCGSFLIGYTAKDAEQGRSKFQSHLQYGAGKTLSYTMFGALFGVLGSILRITPLISGISLGLAGAFLVLYGLNMLNTFQFLKAIRIRQPEAIAHFVTERRKQFHSPFFIGFFSGFIFGCGPLQVMYVLAAANGSAFEGAKMLMLFGLGTLPALIGFGLFARLLSSAMTRRVIHASGIILIVLGSMMINRGIMRSQLVNETKTVHPCCQEQKQVDVE